MAIAFVAFAAAAPAHGQPTKKVTLATFAGAWGGHTRSLSISRSGLAKERVDDGCCDHLFSARYKLSNPRGTRAHPIVTATVTWAQVPDPSSFTSAFPAPRVGQRTTLTIRYTSKTNVLTVHARKLIYCKYLKPGGPSLCGA